MSTTETPAPLTWVDVARRIAASEVTGSSAPISRIRVGWDGLSVEVRDHELGPSAVASWLERLFPGRVVEEPMALRLDGPAHAALLPVETEFDPSPPSYRPSFGIVDGVVDLAEAVPPEPRRRPVPVVAALSVKGGTGRTTTAVALALRWAKAANRPILLVDADLEAPGISYLFQAARGEARVSLEDVIALAHAEGTLGTPETVRFAVDRIRDHVVEGNLVVLPIRRNLDELASSGVRPEHLSTPAQPFALADLLSSIANEAGCAGVVVDVRAGLVPISVNLGLDPDIAPVVVTSLSAQSLQATGSLVRFLAREVRRAGGRPRRPLLVVNRVPSVFQQAGMADKLLEPLVSGIVAELLSNRTADAGPDETIFEGELDVDPVTVVQVVELPDLQVADGRWDTFLDQLENSGFSRRIGSQVDRWLESEVLTSELPPPRAGIALKATDQDTTERREKLASFTDRLVAAETADDPVSATLFTPPLIALATRFRSDVPVAVSEGAKGTGKTLNARFLVAQENWHRAVRTLTKEGDAVPALMLPIYGSVQSSEAVQKQFDSARRTVANALGFGDPMPISETRNVLRERMCDRGDALSWTERWLDVVAWAAGFEPHVAAAGPRFLERLRQLDKRVVAVVEGLEELYVSVTDEGVAEMLRGALVDLPLRLRTERLRPLGLITLARRDSVEAAVRQNLDQYRREYAPYALSWSEDDVLELAAWLGKQSGSIPDLWNEAFRSKPRNEKAAALERLWGRKLGPDDTKQRRVKEAYTATWIVAVLSDLQGRLVPRDLVRLLANAAKVTPTPDELREFPNRLLVPRALKAAVGPTSEAKVRETEEEIQELRPVFGKFRMNPDKVAAPINQEALSALSISNEDVEVLRRHGIVFGDAPPYEVPELFRRGLGLRHTGARHSVVNLYRRARQRVGPPY